VNLLSNAEKYGGERKEITLRSYLEGEWACVSILDRGAGVPAGEEAKIFQPFYRAPAAQKKTKGAGLGLAITKLLVELHHGRLWVETEPNRGSCFSFTLHSATPPRPATAKISLPSPSHHQIA